MAVFRCKSCGGDLDVHEGVSVVECEYCGNKQTLPKVTDENLQALFNRANFLRQKCEFDKAEKLYEKILEQDEREAEAYWGIILCKFGIEYVKDPGTENMIPTCHRASYESIVADDYYKQAIKYADAIQRPVYEADAKKIDGIQKQILEISRKEKPYDVFICYKETDENGKRTHDSVMANDIYHQLTQEGFKVFYAAITLEGKLGSAYEPIIFAALHSSKVMLAVGSKPEYFQATWVRNEWSRYMQLMKKDRSRLLIPCYSGMDAYDLPEEFAHLQAQDMGKIGFINDLIRGIKKVIVKEEPKAAPTETIITTAAPTNVAPLIKRAFMFLEDGDFTRADELFEQVLNQEPENAMAYVGKMMIALKVLKMNDLEELADPFDGEPNYKKAMRFGDESLKSTLEGYNTAIRNRNANAKQEKVYVEADGLARNHKNDPNNLIQASKLFASIKGYKDAEQRSKDCVEFSKEVVYKNARELMKGGAPEDYWDAEALFGTIKGYKDADTLAKQCGELAVEAAYNGAVDDMNSAKRAKDYEFAAKQFDELENYKNSKALAIECRKRAEKAKTEESYQKAVGKMSGDYTLESLDEAIKIFESLGKYKDSVALTTQCYKMRIAIYDERTKSRRAEKMKAVIKAFTFIAIFAAIIGAIVLCVSMCGAKKRAAYKEAETLVNAGEWEKAVAKLEEIDFAYKDVGKMLYKARSNLIIQYFNEGKIKEAEAHWVILVEKHIIDDDLKLKLTYHQAGAYANSGDYVKAKDIYEDISEYSDVQDKITKLRADVLDKVVALVSEKKYQEAYELVSAFDFSEEEFPRDAEVLLRCLAEGDYIGAARAGLSDIEVPEGVTEFKYEAFADCSTLKSIKLPSTLTSINANVFRGCTSLTSIVIPEGVTVISSGAFSGCYRLSSVTLPSTLTKIESNVFKDCTSLTSITLPASLTVIGDNAFENCCNLAEVYNLSTLNIEKGADINGSVAKHAVVVHTDASAPSILLNIDDFIFMKGETETVLLGYAGKSNVLVLPENANGSSYKIADYAFHANTSITSVTLSDGVTSIGEYAFRNCEKLETVLLGSNLTTIGNFAFNRCGALKEITFPASLVRIGMYAFEYTGLERAVFIETSGWWWATNSDATSGQNFAESTFIDASSAANTLVHDLYDVWWNRTK